MRKTFISFIFFSGLSGSGSIYQISALKNIILWKLHFFVSKENPVQESLYRPNHSMHENWILDEYCKQFLFTEMSFSLLIY